MSWRFTGILHSFRTITTNCEFHSWHSGHSSSIWMVTVNATFILIFWVSQASESCSDHLKEKSKANTSINSLAPRVHTVCELSAFGYALTRAQNWRCASVRSGVPRKFAPIWWTHTLSVFSSSASGRRCDTKMKCCYSASSAHHIQFVAGTKPEPEPIWCVMQVQCKQPQGITYRCKDSASLLHPRLDGSHELIV